MTRSMVARIRPAVSVRLIPGPPGPPGGGYEIPAPGLPCGAVTNPPEPGANAEYMSGPTCPGCEWSFSTPFLGARQGFGASGCLDRRFGANSEGSWPFGVDGGVKWSTVEA